MPTTLEATQYLQENGVIFAPGKASNAGGVATSALEMSQNSERLSWTFEEVDAKLQNIMVNICHNAADAAKRYGAEGNYVVGANIAGSGNCIRHILYVKYNQKDLRSNPEIFLIYAKMLNDIGCVGGRWEKNPNDSFSGACLFNGIE